MFGSSELNSMKANQTHTQTGKIFSVIIY